MLRTSRGTGFMASIVVVLFMLVAGQPREAEAGRGPKHFVLVHGSWHGAWCWYKVATALERVGHKVTTINLPSHAVDDVPAGTVTLQDYVNSVTSVLDASPEPVILVGHSLGGIVISSAAEARPNKIEKLVYLAAFMLQSGQTLLDVGLADTDSLVPTALILRPDQGIADIDISKAKDVFYNTSDNIDITLAKTLLQSDPLAPFATPLQLTPQGYGSVRRFYITTLRDRAVSIASQRRMLAAQPVERTYVIDSDHSPFLSAPFLLSTHLLSIADR